MRPGSIILLAAVMALSACERRSAQVDVHTNAPAPASAPSRSAAPVEPLPPGSPGALPDDRTPVSEAPFTPESPQGAANVVQTYFALVEQKRYAEAFKLWRPDDFAKADVAGGLDKYQEYHGLVGAPGAMEGAAGSSYIEVPIQTYGRLKTGAEIHEGGVARLRRVNDVPGATPEQLQWRIVALELTPIGR